MDEPILKPITEQYSIDFVPLADDYSSIDMNLRLEATDLSSTYSQIKSTENIVDNFVTTLPNSMDDSDKIYTIYDWICNRTDYDYTISDTSHNLTQAILGNPGVCDSFSGAFKYVCDKAGITCVEVRGCSYDPQTNDYTQNHAWNLVYVNNTWKIVDCTYGVQYKTSTIPHNFCCSNIEDSLASFKPEIQVIGYTANQVYVENMVG